MNCEGAYLGNSLVNSACPTPREFTQNFVYFCFGSVEQQMCENSIFFTPVKYTLVCHKPQVYWATQHTTVCLYKDSSVALASYKP